MGVSRMFRWEKARKDSIAWEPGRQMVCMGASVKVGTSRQE
jgi:hypothetical protein